MTIDRRATLVVANLSRKAEALAPNQTLPTLSKPKSVAAPTAETSHSPADAAAGDIGVACVGIAMLATHRDVAVCSIADDLQTTALLLRHEREHPTKPSDTAGMDDLQQ